MYFTDGDWNIDCEMWQRFLSFISFLCVILILGKAAENARPFTKNYQIILTFTSYFPEVKALQQHVVF